MQNRLGALIFVLGLGLSVALFATTPAGQAEGFLAFLFAPVQETFSSSTAGFTDVFVTMSSAMELRARKEELEKENAELRQANRRITELERQNQDLLAELKYKQTRPEHELLPAAVLTRDPTNLVHSLTIDRGRDDGVREGMTVLTPKGLVGQVSRVAPRSAKVLLITDTGSGTDVVARSSNARGIVSGQRRRDLLVMRYIRQDAILRAGDWVVTSGLGGVFPPGIPVGKVSYVQQRDTEMFQEAFLEPEVDFAQLDRVLI
ncbi:MAG: rod shape-determining protein MreC, partial [Chloroflexi bacterium]|nr:rod shape-determining protein MreC [Chloroflexota bacterium]